MMKEFKYLTVLSVFVTFVFVSVNQAVAVVTQTATLSTPGTTRTLNLPESADKSPVISLGVAIDPATGEQVEGYAIIHRKEKQAQSGNARKPSGTTCYTYLSGGAKWRAVEPWVMNPGNSHGLNQSTVFDIVSAGISKWENATDGNLINNTGTDVLGTGSSTSQTLLADTVSPDNQNEIYFGDITDSNTIAVTIVWGIFSGPPQGRSLVEWDQVYNDIDYVWSAETESISGKMDFDNIATHEIGHSFGMGDLYNSCVDETMYGYSTEGEISKRTLNSGDVLGIDKLY